MRSPVDGPQVHDARSQVDKYLVFAFGVAFVSVLLWLVFRTNTPLNADQARLVRLVSALAAAGVAAAVPGIAHTDLRYRKLLRASGAIVLFFLVYIYEPQRAVAPPGTWPTKDASAVVDRHLSLIDSGNYEQAYAELSAEGRKRFTKQEFVEAFRDGRQGFGAVQTRVRTGVSGVTALPDGTAGPFKVYGYVTTFAGGVSALEPVWIIASGPEDWGVIFHNVYPCPANQCGAPPAAMSSSTPPTVKRQDAVR
jgi:hypothetical protein